ncbi:MAG: TetR/AcrR family transcriptional regulator [Bacteroidota bacterium]
MSKAEKTRQFIIEKTAGLFNKKGFAGTSMFDLTEATGLSKGALYGNFKNKDEIALAVFEHNTKIVREDLIASLAKVTGAVNKLLAIPVYYKAIFPAVSAHGGCPILNTAVEADDSLPALRQKVNEVIETWKNNIVNTIAGGIASGEMKPVDNPAKYAAIIIALFEGGVLLAKSTGDTAFLDACLERITTIVQTELAS